MRNEPPSEFKFLNLSYSYLMRFCFYSLEIVLSFPAVAISLSLLQEVINLTSFHEVILKNLS